MSALPTSKVIYIAKKIIEKKSRMKLIMIIRRLGSLSIFLPVMSKIINYKRSGPKPIKLAEFTIHL